MLLHEIPLDELEACIELIELWFREDTEIEEARYDDKTYKQAEEFLKDINGHRLERRAMAHILNVLETERDRRKADPSAV